MAILVQYSKDDVHISTSIVNKELWELIKNGSVGSYYEAYRQAFKRAYGEYPEEMFKK